MGVMGHWITIWMWGFVLFHWFHHEYGPWRWMSGPRGLWYRSSGSLKTIVKGPWKPVSGVGLSRLVQDEEHVCQGSLCTVYLYVYRGSLLRCRSAYFSVEGFGGETIWYLKNEKFIKRQIFFIYFDTFNPKKCIPPNSCVHIYWGNNDFLKGGDDFLIDIFRNIQYTLM